LESLRRSIILTIAKYSNISNNLKYHRIKQFQFNIMAFRNFYAILVFTLLMISSVVNGFVTNPQAMRSNLAAYTKVSFARLAAELNDFEEKIQSSAESSTRNPTLILDQARKATTAVVSVWLVSAQVALADSPDWGVFEGRIGSLLHPVAMSSLLLLSMYTAYLGFQWRRQRTLGDEISTLKKSIPALDGAGSVSVALAAAKEANDLYKINALTAALEIESKVSMLVAERKSLAEAGLRDKHFQQGALLAFIGTCFAIEVSNDLY
jgi:hypothetical protein